MPLSAHRCFLFDDYDDDDNGDDDMIRIITNEYTALN